MKLLCFHIQDDILTCYRAVLYLLLNSECSSYESNDINEILLEAYVEVFCTNDFGFFTHNNIRTQKHKDIAALILNFENPTDIWNQMNDSLVGVKQRLSCNYYCNDSLNIQYHIAFMWQVGMCMLDVMLDKRDNCNHNDSEFLNVEYEAKILWESLWKDAIKYLRRFGRFQSDEIEGHICQLICYYYAGVLKVLSAKDVIAQIMPLFEELKNRPLIVLKAIDILINNGMHFSDFVGGKFEKFFNARISEARDIADGQENLKWVQKLLHKERYISNVK